MNNRIANAREGEGVHGPTAEVVANVAGAPAQLKDWVEIAVVGEWRGHPTGPEVIAREDLAGMLFHFEGRYAAHGVDLVIDYDHASLRNGEAPAAGWIKALRLNADGLRLEGRVEWTDNARRRIEAREYRYLSPVFQFNHADPVSGERRNVVLDSIGLTNRPFLTELAPVANRAGAGAQPPEEEIMDLKSLAQQWKCTPAEAAQRLGVAEDADAATVLDALVALAAKAADLEQKSAEQTTAANDRGKAVANALGVAEDADETALQAAVIRLKAPQAGVGMIANALGLKAGAALDDVLAKCAELNGAGKKQKAETLVAHAVAARKIAPAQKPWWLQQAEDNFSATEQVINALPAILDASGAAKPPAGDGSGGFMAKVAAYQRDHKPCTLANAISALARQDPEGYKAAEDEIVANAKK